MKCMGHPFSFTEPFWSILSYSHRVFRKVQEHSSTSVFTKWKPRRRSYRNHVMWEQTSVAHKLTGIFFTFLLGFTSRLWRYEMLTMHFAFKNKIGAPPLLAAVLNFVYLLSARNFMQFVYFWVYKRVLQRQGKFRVQGLLLLLDRIICT